MFSCNRFGGNAAGVYAWYVLSCVWEEKGAGEEVCIGMFRKFTEWYRFLMNLHPGFFLESPREVFQWIKSRRVHIRLVLEIASLQRIGFWLGPPNGFGQMSLLHLCLDDSASSTFGVCVCRGGVTSWCGLDHKGPRHDAFLVSKPPPPSISKQSLLVSNWSHVTGWGGNDDNDKDNTSTTQTRSLAAFSVTFSRAV